MAAVTYSKKPFFSIAIPAYGYNGKGAEFLEHNLSIISKQSFKNFEVVISDHSIDNTIYDIWEKWSKILPATVYLKNDKGRGFISPNLNNAMKECKGKYIKILFQDDFLFDNESLQTQHDILEANPEIKWLVTTFQHSNDGVTFYRHYIPKYSEDILTGNNTLGNPSNLTIKNEDIIYFDETLNWLVDCEYYHRMNLKFGKPTIISPITVVNRTHGNGLTDTTPQNIKDKELKMVLEKHA